MSVAGKLEALDHACAGNVDRSESSGDSDDISSNAGSSPSSHPERELNESRRASSVEKPSALVAAKKEDARQGGTVCEWVRTCRPGGTS